MREIKFRGKTADGVWLFGDLRRRGRHISIIYEVFQNENTTGYMDFAVLPDTVGQFTGFRDKHGKEIYEGDIMNDPTSENVGVVQWNSILCQFQLSWNNMPTAADVFFMAKSGSLVIGNIHDNPNF